jgi:hypothetical protein
MITLADVCDKVSVPISAIGDIPLNIPITVLQQCNNTNQQTHFATRANYTDAQVMLTWIWSINCVFVSTADGILGNKFFVEWNGEIYVFDMDSNPVRELVFNAIFYDDYHKPQ